MKLEVFVLTIFFAFAMHMFNVQTVYGRFSSLGKRPNVKGMYENVRVDE